MRNSRVLNDTCISENNENKRFGLQYTFKTGLGGTTTVFQKNQIYVMKEQKKRRIVCEDQPQRRLTSRD